ncbi:MAG TPA: 3-hydroxyacyl-ACP dehydratase FabZ [Gammaproteobacteria bacterium]
MTESSGLHIEGILERLPHRFPFLLVDRVLEVTKEKVVAIKNVTANEAYFQGHFPGYPVMPGVLIIEALAQAGGVLAWESATEEERTSVLYFAGIENARFKLPVRPGDQLVLKVELVKRRRQLWCFTARAEVDGKLAVETELLLAHGPKA